jgi:hypothetical protein
MEGRDVAKGTTGRMGCSKAWWDAGKRGTGKRSGNIKSTMFLKFLLKDTHFRALHHPDLNLRYLFSRPITNYFCGLFLLHWVKIPGLNTMFFSLFSPFTIRFLNNCFKKYIQKMNFKFLHAWKYFIFLSHFGIVEDQVIFLKFWKTLFLAFLFTIKKVPGQHAFDSLEVWAK